MWTYRESRGVSEPPSLPLPNGGNHAYSTRVMVDKGLRDTRQPLPEHLLRVGPEPAGLAWLGHSATCRGLAHMLSYLLCLNVQLSFRRVK